MTHISIDTLIFSAFHQFTFDAKHSHREIISCLIFLYCFHKISDKWNAKLLTPLTFWLHFLIFLTLKQDLTQDSATLTGWRQTQQSREGNILSLAHAGILHSRGHVQPGGM